jgi:hypothetical protein
MIGSISTACAIHTEAYCLDHIAFQASVAEIGGIAFGEMLAGMRTRRSLRPSQQACLDENKHAASWIIYT